MKRGKGTGKHRDTGRQRSEPEEGKHARQPEGPTERKGGPAAGTIWRAGVGAGYGRATFSRPDHIESPADSQIMPYGRDDSVRLPQRHQAGYGRRGFRGFKTSRQRAEWRPTKRAYVPQPHE